MNLVAILISFVCALGLFLFSFPHKAYAYLDPGTGSYILQLVLGFLLGGVFAIKIFWTKIKTFLKKLVFKKKKSEQLDG